LVALDQETASTLPRDVTPLAAARRDFEKGHLRRAVTAVGGRQVAAAELLGISPKSLGSKLRMYDLEEAATNPRPDVTARGDVFAASRVDP
jgi:DNA-binding NtrC family response regulator